MVLAGKAFTTFSSRMATTSASSKSRKTSFKEDVAATKRVLAQQDGPSILVAHSYGGAVITEAGTDPPVVGLVYVAAHMPDSGEKESDDGKRFPSDPRQIGRHKEKRPTVFTYVDPTQFHELFAADLPGDQAAFMARSAGAQLCGQFLSDDHHGCLENQTELDASGGKRSNHQPGLGTLVCQAGQEPHGRKSQAPATQSTSRIPRKVADVIESAARAVSK